MQFAVNKAISVKPATHDPSLSFWSYFIGRHCRSPKWDRIVVDNVGSCVAGFNWNDTKIVHVNGVWPLTWWLLIYPVINWVGRKTGPYLKLCNFIWTVLTGPADWVCHIGTLMLCVEAVA